MTSGIALLARLAFTAPGTRLPDEPKILKSEYVQSE
jgi:hypothetical protein